MLTWNDYQLIGAALDLAHPMANYLTISDDALKALVIGLPEFAAGSRPPEPADLTAIRFAWIRVAEEAE